MSEVAAPAFSSRRRERVRRTRLYCAAEQLERMTMAGASELLIPWAIGPFGPGGSERHALTFV